MDLWAHLLVPGVSMYYTLLAAPETWAERKDQRWRWVRWWVWIGINLLWIGAVVSARSGR